MKPPILARIEPTTTQVEDANMLLEDSSFNVYVFFEKQTGDRGIKYWLTIPHWGWASDDHTLFTYGICLDSKTSGRPHFYENDEDNRQ